jgi:hypothetical protein
MYNWIKVERGIRHREHPTRKYGVPRRFDRYYVIRIAVDGVMRKRRSAGNRRGSPWKKLACSALR